MFQDDVRIRCPLFHFHQCARKKAFRQVLLDTEARDSLACRRRGAQDWGAKMLVSTGEICTTPPKFVVTIILLPYCNIRCAGWVITPRELGIQVVQREHDSDFDPLDATKIILEELVPVKNIETLTVNRNVDEFLEVEQVIFCTANIIPVINHSNDLLLQDRNFSYHDTQLSWIGRPNFVSLPIHRPIRCPVFNNQRDGLHRAQITKSKVSYWANRFEAPKPVEAKNGGQVHRPVEVSGVKIKARGEKYNEHYTQSKRGVFGLRAGCAEPALQRWNSMSGVEKHYIMQVLSLEFGHVVDKRIQERVVERFCTSVLVYIFTVNVIR
jgi:catalase